MSNQKNVELSSEFINRVRALIGVTLYTPTDKVPFTITFVSARHFNVSNTPENIPLQLLQMASEGMHISGSKYRGSSYLNSAGAYLQGESNNKPTTPKAIRKLPYTCIQDIGKCKKGQDVTVLWNRVKGSAVDIIWGSSDAVLKMNLSSEVAECHFKYNPKAANSEIN